MKKSGCAKALCQLILKIGSDILNQSLKILLLYLILINLYCFFLCAYDKEISKKKSKRRVPEKTFLILSMLGGSPLMLSGMFLFRHKTKHKKFIYGIPFILLVQIILILYVLIKERIHFL
jgi:Predicted membrane protein